MNFKALAILLLALPLTACGLDALEGKKSDFQIEQERRQALAMPVPAAAVTPTEPAAPAVEAPAAVAAAPAPIEPPAAPEPAAPTVCQAIFRVLSCGDNGEFIYL